MFSGRPSGRPVVVRPFALCDISVLNLVLVILVEGFQ